MRRRVNGGQPRHASLRRRHLLFCSADSMVLRSWACSTCTAFAVSCAASRASWSLEICPSFTASCAASTESASDDPADRR